MKADVSEVQIASYLTQNFAANYSQLAPVALIIYDYCLTIGSEVRFIWGRKLPAAFVFFLNRVTMVGLAVTGILGILSWSSVEDCKGLLIANEVFLSASYIIWAWVSAIRVRALSQSRALACVTLLLGLMPFVSNLVRAATQNDSNPVLTGVGEGPSALSTSRILADSYAMAVDVRCPLCATWPIRLTHIHEHVLYGSRACAIASDLIVIVATWYRTSGPGNRLRVFCLRELLRGRTDAPTLADLLIRDGMLCFLVLLALNVAQMLTSFQVAYGVLYVFITSMASVLVSRLLINLNEAVGKDVVLHPGTQPGSHWLESPGCTEAEVPTIMFASVITDRFDTDV
ncbi:uncharacterized protein B0H18DRAFT_954997 [Fomitopsis serialis]|uniref:uncharacterized protein n=1 Tax=Fomitopsis serialis TaxID=139415 RepID=UPI00200756DA|nr:uncharacterized protein B0H18DRAFT_954997 [Neoantrodia serialis]KAH9925808.1 hypothetical protein B0H18DRAFT_954997 [Neoantrodia serialis]